MYWLLTIGMVGGHCPRYFCFRQLISSFWVLNYLHCVHFFDHIKSLIVMYEYFGDSVSISSLLFYCCIYFFKYFLLLHIRYCHCCMVVLYFVVLFFLIMVLLHYCDWLVVTLVWLRYLNRCLEVLVFVLSLLWFICFIPVSIIFQVVIVLYYVTIFVFKYDSFVLYNCLSVQ